MENESSQDQSKSQDKKQTDNKAKRTDRIMDLITGAVSLLIVFIMIRGPLLTFVLDKDGAPPTANDAQLVLSFIEAASVFVTIAGIAAAIFGVKKISDIEQEQVKVTKRIEDEVKRIEELRKKQEESTSKTESNLLTINEQVEKVRSFEENFEQFANVINTSLEKSENELRKAIVDFNQINKWTQQAVYEMQLGNYEQAHLFATKALDTGTYRDTQNIDFPLYLAAWLEIHHLQIPSLDDALRHFEALLGISPEWPTAQAGYGVALRRKAKALTKQKSDDSEVKIYYANAEYHLRQALRQEPNLTDPNRESYWGPLGGLLRDTKRYDEALEAYNKALKITPKSSYPQGNLAALLLWRASSFGEQDWGSRNLAEAKRAFEKTLEFAEVELQQSPGDYFNLMDIAMAETILGHKAIDNVTLRGDESLDLALQTDVTSTLLKVSVEQGWHFIFDNFPDGEINAPIRDAISNAIKKIETRIKEIESSQEVREETATTTDSQSESRDPLQILIQGLSVDTKNALLEALCKENKSQHPPDTSS